ncbi:hypothetical protein HJG60_007932 [Phyllostomus discolor]|uniref:Uncharacterized protein n=1 Tax=Phyllostomus discolor TaxID=89673 RepID=A0A834BMZ3_9CHIR|nr:hypothetical protein HJG60_007932 [Phyllostomus discolor]
MALPLLPFWTRTAVRPTVTPGDHKRLAFVLQERPSAAKVVSEPLCSRQRQSAAQDTDKENLPGHRPQIKQITSQQSDERMLGKLPDCSFYLINLFPESQIPSHTFFPLNSRPLTCTFFSL